MNQFCQRERETDEVLRLLDGISQEIGVTRLADITHLDNIGIPVYCSYRPRALLLQANGGKGITHEQAKCSAMMEALEFMHFERLPRADLIELASYVQLSCSKTNVLDYGHFAVSPSAFYTDQIPIKWIKIEDILNGGEYSCPADMVYFSNRFFASANTNGLASGNSNREATLHGIYEVIERDAYARILVDGKLDVRGVGKRIRLSTIEDPLVKSLVERVEQSGSQLYLILLPSSISVYTFWSVIIDEYSTEPIGSFNIGLGCHAHPSVAAIRAITEAAQSRLIYIHGNREDIRHKAVFSNNYVVSTSIYSFFRGLPQFDFSALCREDSPCLSTSLDCSLSNILDQLAKNGFPNLYIHILRDESATFSVVKSIIPGMRCETRLL